MLSVKARHNRLTTWALTGLEVGALLFVGGIALLYLNPFWHFDDGGFLDWRLHWWNAAAGILAGTGLLTEALALIGSIAILASRLSKYRSWPYFVAAALLCFVVAWAASDGFVSSLDAHFEWNAAEGFSAFRLQTEQATTGAARLLQNPLWQSIVEIQVQPLLRGYFKVNDWLKMNGNISLKVVNVVPIAWPVALGSGGESLEDPDETPLMRAADEQDLKALRLLLVAATRTDVNALDQGGQTALILACRHPRANPDVVKALLAAGADVNLRARNGYAPLTWALARNNSDVIRLLRHAGGKP
jgi:hypothetical protein